MIKKKISSTQKKSSKHAQSKNLPKLNLKHPGLEQFSPTEELLNEDFLGRVIWECLKDNLAEDMAKSHDYYLVPPYDHSDVITGQGTIGLEILEDVDPAAIFIPIGGGGLIAGIAVAIKKSNPTVKIIGVEPELENDAFQSFKGGKRVSLAGPSNSIADAIKVQMLGDITYPLICKYVDDIVTVNEEQITAATVMHAEKAHIIVEPAGALALAAAVNYDKKLDTAKPVVCITSGGNIPLAQLCLLAQKKGILYGNFQKNS